MSKQSETFYQGEGDNWFLRNSKASKSFNPENDPICRAVKSYIKSGDVIAEVGCSFPKRLSYLSKCSGVSGYGVDPSAKAIEEGSKQYPELELSVNTADHLPWPDQSVNVLVYGFCLYLASREELFQIAKEGNRVLKENGLIAVYDFVPPQNYYNEYAHLEGIKCYKMDHSLLWKWNPQFVEVYRKLSAHGNTDRQVELIHPDDRVGVSVLLKQSIQSSFPPRPNSY